MGFDKPEKDRVQRKLSPEHQTEPMTTTVGKVRNNKNGSTVNAGVENNEETVQTSMEVDRSGGPQSGDGTARLDETTLQRQNPDFEERVRDIDDALNYAPEITLSVDVDSDSHAVKAGKYLLTNGNKTQLLISESGVSDFRSDKGQSF